jgi:hypothetical protein
MKTKNSVVSKIWEFVMILTAYMRPVIHGKSKDGSKYTAASKVCPMFHFCMHGVQVNKVLCEFFVEAAVFRRGDRKDFRNFHANYTRC